MPERALQRGCRIFPFIPSAICVPVAIPRRRRRRRFPGTIDSTLRWHHRSSWCSREGSLWRRGNGKLLGWGGRQGKLGEYCPFRIFIRDVVLQHSLPLNNFDSCPSGSSLFFWVHNSAIRPWCMRAPFFRASRFTSDWFRTESMSHAPIPLSLGSGLMLGYLVPLLIHRSRGFLVIHPFSFADLLRYAEIDIHGER